MDRPILFSPAALQQVINETIPQALPADHHNAIVGAIDTDGVKVVAGFSLGQDQRWQLQGAYRHDWAGGDSIGGRVLVSW